MALNDKQRRFAEEYIVDLNATQAAIRAGYSAKTAKQQGQRLLTNVDVQRHLSAAQAERSKRTKVDADWVLQRLTEEAKADLADIYDENGNLKPIHTWPLIWRQGLVQGVETVTEKIGYDAEGNPEFAQVRKVKLPDRSKRIDMIGRHVGVQAFKERVEIDASDDLKAMMAAARDRVVAKRE